MKDWGFGFQQLFKSNSQGESLQDCGAICYSLLVGIVLLELTFFIKMIQPCLFPPQNTLFEHLLDAHLFKALDPRILRASFDSNCRCGSRRFFFWYPDFRAANRHTADVPRTNAATLDQH